MDTQTIKLWDPTVQDVHRDGPKNKYYDEMVRKFGKEITDDCKHFTEENEPYPTNLIRFLHLIARGDVKASDEEGYGPEALKEYEEKRKSDYHFEKKYGKPYDDAANAELDRVLGEDPFERKTKPEVIEVPKKSKKSVDAKKYFYQDVKNSTPIKNEVFNNMENTNNDDIFYSPMFLFLYILKKRPFPSKKDRHKTYEHWYRKKGLIVIEADKAEVSEALNIKYRTITRWFNLLIKQHLILPIKSKGETIYIVGYIENNEEFLLYEFNRTERLLEYNKLNATSGN